MPVCPNAGIGEDVDVGLIVCESLPLSPATVSLVPIPATVSLPSKSLVPCAVIVCLLLLDELPEAELLMVGVIVNCAKVAVLTRASTTVKMSFFIYGSSHALRAI